MNYPEELREKYNEVMYDERSIIEKFLKDQYDIRYGRQRDTWHFESAVRLIGIYGCEIAVTDARLDKNNFVTFTGVCCNERNDDYECSDFAYGELSKIIEALPDADEIKKKNALADLDEMKSNLRIDLLLGESPFIYNTDKKMCWSEFADGSAFNFNKLADAYGTDFIVKFRDHINIEVLHRSDEYKKVMEILSLQENLRFEWHNFGEAQIVIDKTDVTLDVSAVQRDDNGNLEIYGADVDADEDITLTEKEIKPQYLACIIECMKPKYTDIMDTYNGHNSELVRKINAAWKSGRYNQEFGYIVYSIAQRDYSECQEKFDCDMGNFLSAIIDDCDYGCIHNVLENICDDKDLETILSFIRYEE